MLDLIARQVSGLEVRCFRSDNPKGDETQLLTTYFKEHFELPPLELSRAESSRLMGASREVVRLTSEGKITLPHFGHTASSDARTFSRLIFRDLGMMWAS
jgi:hypothetical protein